jgi:hypothetical protein
MGGIHDTIFTTTMLNFVLCFGVFASRFVGIAALI